MVYKQLFRLDGDSDDEFVNYVFNVFDKDKNGTIDFTEFMCGLSVISRGTVNEKLKCTSGAISQDMIPNVIF